MPLDNLDTGLSANRPAPSPYNKEKFWLSTDTGVVSVSDGVTWTDIGAGGGGAVGAGVQVENIEPIIAAVAGGTAQPIITSNPPNISATLLHSSDLWVQATVRGGNIRVNTPGYSGRLAWQTQLVTSGPPSPTVGMSIHSSYGGRDGALPEASPGEVFIDFGESTRGFLLPANTAATVTMMPYLTFDDDGSNGVYQIAVLAQPLVTMIGVPV